MTHHVIYEETKFSLGIFIILGFFTALMIVALFYQIFVGPLGSKPAPTWILALFVFFFILTTVNFSRLKVILTDAGVKVSYGIFGSSLGWSDITRCELDEKNYFYGWGIRFGRYKKQWVWVYNVIGGPRVAMITEKKKPKGLLFSSGNPDRIIEIAREKIGG